MSKRYGCDERPFNGCIHSKYIFDKLINMFDVDVIVETGTNFGHTTRSLASSYPDKKVHTVEINPNKLQNFVSLPNIIPYIDNSVSFLDKFGQSGGFNQIVLLYLDAHGFSGDPLKDEIKIIEKYNVEKYIIIIDDFVVPNRPTLTNDGYNISHVLKHLKDPESYLYFFKNRQEHPNNCASGQFIMISKKLLEKYNIKEEQLCFKEGDYKYSIW